MRLFLAFCVCAFAACGKKTAPTVAAPVEIVGLAGLEARIANSHGRPLLLNFWAMW